MAKKRGNGEGGITRHKKSGLFMARYTVQTATGTKRNGSNDGSGWPGLGFPCCYLVGDQTMRLAVDGLRGFLVRRLGLLNVHARTAPFLVFHHEERAGV